VELIATGEADGTLSRRLMGDDEKRRASNELCEEKHESGHYAIMKTVIW
jgi:hypothetical protein